MLNLPPSLMDIEHGFNNRKATMIHGLAMLRHSNISTSIVVRIAGDGSLQSVPGIARRGLGSLPRQ